MLYFLAWSHIKLHAGGKTMEAKLSDWGKTVGEVQVVEGSHIYLKDECGQDVFFEWKDAPEMLRREALAYREKMEESFRGASAALFGAITPA
jgi:hypothetical protein